MAYESDFWLFRSLDDAEEFEFRAYARANDPPEGADWSILHPVCVQEWTARGLVPNGS